MRSIKAQFWRSLVKKPFNPIFPNECHIKLQIFENIWFYIEEDFLHTSSMASYLGRRVCEKFHFPMPIVAMRWVIRNTQISIFVLYFKFIQVASSSFYWISNFLILVDFCSWKSKAFSDFAQELRFAYLFKKGFYIFFWKLDGATYKIAQR